MIRIVLFLLVIGALSLGAAWLADRPGDVVIIWQGLRIKTSVMVLGAGLLVALAVLLAIWSLIRADPALARPVVAAQAASPRRARL